MATATTSTRAALLVPAAPMSSCRNRGTVVVMAPRISVTPAATGRQPPTGRLLGAASCNAETGLMNAAP